MKKIVAIDIGNSKTEYILGNSRGEISGYLRSSGANYQVLGYNNVLNTLSNSLGLLLSNSDLELDQLGYVYIGAAGADSETDYENLDRLFKELLGDVPYSFSNDGVIAMKNGLINSCGIVITCGTGNINYGIDESSRIMRLGGYCQDLGDVLGTETIAKIVTSSAARSYDGRGFPSILPAIIQEKLKIEEFFQIEELDLESEVASVVVSSFLEACEKWDGKALSIAWDLTQEVINIVEYFHKNLFCGGSEYKLVLDGHIFKIDNPFTRMIKNAIYSRYQLDIVIPETRPVFGAFYMALDCLEISITEHIVKIMKQTFNKELIS